MTKLGVRRGGIVLLCAIAIGAGSMATAGPPDEAVPKPKPQPTTAQESAYVDVISGDDPERGLGLGGIMKSMAECMSPEAAASQQGRPDPYSGQGGVDPSGGLGEVAGLGQRPAIKSKQIPECPAAITVWVGAGHSARPVGNVSTPLVVATTRKRRRHHKHDCCYLVQQVPGSPNG
jgi:hypothetical protein